MFTSNSLVLSLLFYSGSKSTLCSNWFPCSFFQKRDSLESITVGFQVDDEAMDLNKELMNKLLELDDVDAVYTDQK